MAHLSRDSVDRAIAEITADLSSYQIDSRYLSRFTDAPFDKVILALLRGTSDFQHYKFISLLVRKLALSNILELGNYAGASTLCLHAGMTRGARLTSNDVVRDQRYVTDEVLRDPRVRFLIGDACDLSLYGDDVPIDIDFLFEDTFHPYVRDILSIYDHLLADKALVTTNHMNDKEITGYLAELPHDRWDLNQLRRGAGWQLFLFERRHPRTREQRLAAAYKASADVWKARFDGTADRLERVEARRLRNRVVNHLHNNRALHSRLLAIKTAFGILSDEARSRFDAERYYSGQRREQMEVLRKNTIRRAGDY